MSPRRSAKPKPPTDHAAIDRVLRKLTFDDLRQWVGDTILGRGKGYVGKVAGLSRTQDGSLAAWVTGSERYATSVRIEGKRQIESTCTCPYAWGPCKHAVAVVLAAGEALKNKTSIPELAEGDRLSLALSGELDDDGEEWEDDDDVDDETSPPRTRAGRKEKIGEFLAGKSREALLDLMTELAAHHPTVAKHIVESERLASGRVDPLVRELRRKIARVTAEQVWYNPWRGEGSLPDYSPIAERLQVLLDKGHADAVIGLGEELWTRGNEQIGHSHDEGETATAIGECLGVVLKALPRSSLAPPAQLLWVIERMLKDDYSLLDSADTFLKDRTYTRTHWREVAKTLEDRLEAMPLPESNDFSARYPREQLLNTLLDAYGRAGWQARVLPRLEAEADHCACYEALVDALLAAGEREQAHRWCIRGHTRIAAEAPGIAGGLRQRLCEIAHKARKYDVAAAYRAQDFFGAPSCENYRDLQKAAEKAGCWPAVRAAVLGHLETGKLPKKSEWPIPNPEVEPLRTHHSTRERFPDLGTLIDIAILEKRHDDVIELHDRLSRTTRFDWESDKKVADAVADSHPQVALDIWLAIAEALIGRTDARAYEEAAGYLRKMRAVYTKQRRLNQWSTLLDELRQRHKAKRRLLTVLDTLSDRKIAG